MNSHVVQKSVINESLFRVVGTRAMPLLISSALNAAVSVVIVFAIARFTSPKEYGGYVAVLGTIQFGMATLSGGLTTWSTRTISGDSSESHWVLPAIVRWHCILFVILPLVALLCCLVLAFSNKLLATAVILAAYAVIRGGGDALSSSLLASGRTVAVAKANLFETLLSVIFIGGLLFAGTGIVGVASGELVATAGRFIVIAKAAQIGLAAARRAKFDSIKLMLRLSAPIWGVQIVYAAAGRLQPTVIALRSQQTAGFYAAGSRFVETSSFIAAPLNSVLLPLLAQRRNDCRLFRRTLAQAGGLAIAIAVPPAAVLMLFGSQIIEKFLGSQYRDIVPSTSVIAVLIVLTFVSQVASLGLIALQRERIILMTAACSAFALIVSLYLLGGRDDVKLLYQCTVLVSIVTLLVWSIAIVLATRDVASIHSRPLRMSRRTLQDQRQRWMSPGGQSISGYGRWNKAAIAIAAIMCVPMGIALTNIPQLAVLPLVPILLLLLLDNAIVRSATLVFGGLFTFQISEGIGIIKVAYLGCTALIIIIALAKGLEAYEGTSNPFSPALKVSAALFVLNALSLPIAYFNGTPISSWLRDSTAYWLFAAVPIMAMDLRSWRSNFDITLLLVLMGVASGVSIMVTWLNGRGYASWDVDRILYPSPSPAYFLYYYACASALIHRQRRRLWTITGIFIALCFVLTGSRSNLPFLLFIPLLGAIVARGPASRKLSRVLSVIVLTLALVIVFVQVAPYVPGVNLSGMIERYVSATEQINTLEQDDSFSGRITFTKYAWEVLKQNPLLGVGPGFDFNIGYSASDLAGESRGGFRQDTPLIFPTKFGLIGVVLIVLAVLVLVKLVRQYSGTDQARAKLGLSIGLIAIVANLPISVPLQDKGFAFGLFVLVALALPCPNRSGAKRSEARSARYSCRRTSQPESDFVREQVQWR